MSTSTSRTSTPSPIALPFGMVPSYLRRLEPSEDGGDVQGAGVTYEETSSLDARRRCVKLRKPPRLRSPLSCLTWRVRSWHQDASSVEQGITREGMASKRRGAERACTFPSCRGVSPSNQVSTSRALFVTLLIRTALEGVTNSRFTL